MEFLSIICYLPHKIKQHQKPLSRWICVALKISKFSELFDRKALGIRLQGRKLFLRSSPCSHSATFYPKAFKVPALFVRKALGIRLQGRELFLRSTLCSHSARGTPTHVTVANPTERYGIFIENMLNASNQQTQQKAA